MAGRSTTEDVSGSQGMQPGGAVDLQGRGVVDPTKNVESLVRALESSLEKLRVADEKYNNDMRVADARYNDAMRDAEIRRLNELAALRVQYDVIIEGMRSTSLNTTSQLLATQLREVKTDLSDRTAKLEQFRWETGGKAGGQGQVVAWIVTAIAVAAGIMSLIAGFGLHR